MTKFQGHQYRHDHYVTPRSIQGYYPERADRRDIFTGRCALIAVIVLLVLYAVGANL